MESFMHWLLENSLKAGVLAGLVWGIQTLFSNRLSPRWKYFLWALVAIRLIMPNLFPTDFSLFNVWKNSEIQTAIMAHKPAAVKLSQPIKNVEPTLQSIGISSAVIKRHMSPLKILFMIWATGAITLMGLVLYRNHRLMSKVTAKRPLTDQKLLDLLEDSKEQLKLHTPVSVVESPLVGSPALLGFIRPRLLLPVKMASRLSFDNMRHIFLHELTHLKRNDIAANWLIAIVQVLHWFNPVVWYVFMRMRAEREQACDESVLTLIDEKERKDYGRTIITLLESSPSQYPITGMAGILEDQQQMIKRITMIKNFRTMPFRNALLATLIIASLGLICLSEAQSGPKPAKLTEIQKVFAYLTQNGFKKVPMPAKDKYNQLYAKEFSVNGDKINFTNGVIYTSGHAVFHVRIGSGEYQCIADGKAGVGSPAFDQVNTEEVIAFLADSSLSGKLRKIIIPHLEFEKVPLPTVIQIIEQQARRFDQQRQGVKINLEMEPEQLKTASLISMGVDEISLGDALRYVCKIANLQYRVEANGIVLFPEAPKSPYEPVTMAKSAATEWMPLVDSGKYAQSWQDAAAYFKTSVSSEQWEQALKSARTPLGKMLSRKMKSAAYQSSLPGTPDGHYVIIQYETTFENKKEVVETVTPMLSNDGQWRVAGYFIK